MSSNVFAFTRPSTDHQQAFADLYRAQELLHRAGLLLEARYGTTEEGDPWVAFCDPQNGEAIIDVSLIEGEIVANSKAFVSPAKTGEIAAAVQGLLRTLRVNRDGLGSGTHIMVALAVVIATFQVAEADPSSWTPSDLKTLVLAPALTGLGVLGVAEKVAEVAEVMATEIHSATVTMIADFVDHGGQAQDVASLAQASVPALVEDVSTPATGLVATSRSRYRR
jgi:hypothetical protein